MKFKLIIRIMATFFIATLSVPTHAALQYSCSEYGTDSFWWSDFQKTIVNHDLDTMLFGIKIRDWKPEHLEAMRHKEEECMAKSGDKYSEEYLDSKRRGDVLRMEESLAYLKIRDENLRASEAISVAQLQREAERTSEANLNTSETPTHSHKNTSGLVKSKTQETSDSIKQLQEDFLLQSQAQDDHEKIEREKFHNKLIVIVFIAAVIGGWYWNKFVRNRCPNCKSAKYNKIRATEIDRWRGTKVVSEKHSRGTSTRHVQTTFAKIQFEYACNHCQHNWLKVRKEELNNSSTLGRFLAGY